MRVRHTHTHTHDCDSHSSSNSHLAVDSCSLARERLCKASLANWGAGYSFTVVLPSSARACRVALDQRVEPASALLMHSVSPAAALST